MTEAHKKPVVLIVDDVAANRLLLTEALSAESKQGGRNRATGA